MTTIQEQLRAYLGPVASIYPIIAPQGSLPPYVTYQRVGSTVNNVLSGPPSIDQTRMQIDVWDTSYQGAQTLAAQIKTRMQAWPVQNILIGDYDLYEAPVKTFRVLMEFSIWQ
jgi:hypothetical protein